MAFLLDLAGFLVVLASVHCEDAQLAEGTTSPIINMKLDPRRKLLTWNYRGNVMKQECKIDTPPHSSTWQIPQVRDDGTRSCRFPNALLSRGARLTVTVTAADGAAFQDVLEFHNSGRPGSGVANFSCLVSYLHRLTCAWAPGPAAPADVQYHLYGWTSRRDQAVECPQYLVGASGTRVGCRFDELVGTQLTDTYFFWVNGTSQEADIQFSDFPPFRGVQIEKFEPPANLTVSFNGSHHVIRWADPRTRFEVSSRVLCYQLDIQREGSSSKSDPVLLRGSEENVYVMPSGSSRSRHSVRARVRLVHSAVWSQWTDTLRFGKEEPDPSGFPRALLGLVVGAAALAITVLMFLCARFPLRRKLFPPVPQVKREVAGPAVAFPEVTWVGDSPPPSVQEAEDILAVEETLPLDPEQAAVGGPVPPQPRSDSVRPELRSLAMQDS